MTDAAGNQSKPAVLINETCELPSKFVSYAGRRNALKVDATGTTHTVYSTEEGIYYAWWNPEANTWNTKALHCLCDNNDTPTLATDVCPAFEPGKCRKQYGHNIGFAVSTDESHLPGVCFVVTDVGGSDFERTGYVAAVFATSDPQGASPAWQIESLGNARRFHCAITAPQSVLFGDQSGITLVYAEAQGGGSSRLVSREYFGPGNWGSPREVHGALGRDVSLVQELEGGRRLHAVFRDGDHLYYSRKDVGGNWDTRSMVDQFGGPIRGARPSVAINEKGQLGVSFYYLNSDLYQHRGGQPTLALRRAPADDDSTPDVWDTEKLLNTVEPWQTYSLGVTTKHTLWPGELASTSGVYEGNSTSLVMTNEYAKIAFVSGSREAVNVRPKIFSLGELVLASRHLDTRDWRYSVLDGRVEGDATVSYGITQDGMGRIVYHNGLTPELGSVNKRRGSLNFWHSESRRAFYLDELDDPGPNCASLAYRKHEGANAVKEDHLNFRLNPVALGDGSGQMPDPYPVRLFERIRRYQNVNGFPWGGNLPTGMTWETADTSNGDVVDVIKDYLFFQNSQVDSSGTRGLLLQMASLYHHVSSGVFSARLFDTGEISIDEPYYNPMHHSLQGPLIPAIVGGMIFRSSLDTPLAKMQLNVCVPDSCSHVEADIDASRPVSAYASAVQVVTYSTPTTSSNLEARAAQCHAGGVSRVLVTVPDVLAPLSIEGCYECPSGSRVVGVPNSAVPKCQPNSECPDGNMGYRYAGSGLNMKAPFVQCSTARCDDTRCLAEKCAPTEFSDTDSGAGKAVSRDEKRRGVPGLSRCVRCPEGKKRVRCNQAGGCATLADLPPSCEKDADCGDYVNGVRCNDGLCQQTNQFNTGTRWCDEHRDCDYFGGFVCVMNRCMKPSTSARCTTTRYCVNLLQSDDAVCDRGRCLAFCGTHHGGCYKGQCKDSYTGGECNSQVCMCVESFEQERERFKCQSVGCTECVDNAFCIPHGESVDRSSAFTHCPASHRCETSSAAETPVCMARPLFGDYLASRLEVLAPAVPVSGLQKLFNLQSYMEKAMGSLGVTRFFGQASFHEELSTAGFRLLPSTFGQHHQGRISISVEFDGRFDLRAERQGCEAELYTAEEPVIRLETQPYTFGPHGNIYVKAIAGGFYAGTDSYDIPTIEPGDCHASFGYEHCDARDKVTQSIEEEAIINDVANSGGCWVERAPLTIWILPVTTYQVSSMPGMVMPRMKPRSFLLRAVGTLQERGCRGFAKDEWCEPTDNDAATCAEGRGLDSCALRLCVWGAQPKRWRRWDFS